MIVAITGGTGFIGSVLADYHLKRGDSVRVLTRRPPVEEDTAPNFSFFSGDIAAGQGLDDFVGGADVLYHCAGEIHDDKRMHALHVTGTGHLLKAASGKVGRWVQLSSVGVYGPMRSGIVTESDPIRPVGRYEETKAEADLLLIEQAEALNIPYTVIRPSNVFGKGMPNQSLFQLFSMIGRGMFCYIGRPGAFANYVHVKNVVKALTMSAVDGRAIGGVFNVSDQTTIEDFVAAIAEGLGRSAPVLRLPELPLRILARVGGMIPGFPLTEPRIDALTSRVTYSNERIETVLGYCGDIPVAEGILQLAREWHDR